MTSISNNMVPKLQKFLHQLRQGEFADELEKAFQEFNLFVGQHEDARRFLLYKYLPGLYNEGRTGQQQLIFLAARILDYQIPHIAQVVVEVLIPLYARHEDEELLHLLLDILLKYGLDSVVSIESGENLRVEANRVSFLLKITSIRAHIRLKVLQLILKKYVHLLVMDSLPKLQDLPAVIQRLNTTITLLKNCESSELARYDALLPFTLDHVRYTADHSSQIFGKEFDPLQYDEYLFKFYHIPLFPVIESDKLSFSNHKIIFTNEGFGSLPPATIRVQVGEEEFELGESPHLVPSDKVCDVFLEDTATFFSFLKKQKPNVDVKVIFLFKKFGRSYNFGVLAKSVGHWLEQIPTPSWELAQPYEIPIEKLDDKGFERLCEWIVAEYPEKRFKDVRRLNEDGGGERGRDVLATEVATGKRYVFQCKRVQKLGPSHIKKELITFAKYIANDPSIKPDVYVLFMSAALNDKIEAKGNELAKKIGMEIEYWHRSTIDRLVTTNQVVKKRFWKLVRS